MEGRAPVWGGAACTALGMLQPRGLLQPGPAAVQGCGGVARQQLNNVTDRPGFWSICTNPGEGTRSRTVYHMHSGGRG